MRAKLSIMGLYYANPHIFDGFKTPDGIDRQTAIDQILQDCAELEIIFPNPDYMTVAIKRWSDISQTMWERLYNTTVIEYNPIHNYDRTEERDLHVNGTTDNRHTVAAFNSSELEPTYGDNSRGESSDTGTLRTYGNIGVTTTQQMLESERKTVLYNIYDTIVNQFKQRFCIMVY